MIIDIVHLVGIAFLEGKNNPPVAGHFYRPVAFHSAFQLMQVRSRVPHVLHRIRGIKPIQDVRELLSMRSLDPLLRAVKKEVLKSLWAKVLIIS